MARSTWVLFFVFLLSRAVAGTEPTTYESHDGVLVLRNGFVLHGRITPQGDSYLVTFDGKGEARLLSTEVEFACRNLEEAYLIKRDALPSDDLKAHVGLADWCLRHGIMARAADQLLVIQMQDATHPVLAVLERRLAGLSESARRAGGPPTSTTPAPDSERTPASVASVPHVSQIDPSLMQHYTMTIQPILLNRCATHACHGVAGMSNFRLLRPALGHAPTSRLTHRNLQATLAYIDRHKPEASRLLSMAMQPHGGSTSVIFHEKTGNQLSLLTSWVRRLDGQDRSRVGNPAYASAPATLPESLTARSATMQPGPASTLPPTETRPPAADRRQARGPHSASRTVPASYAEDLPSSDPTDPEVFNRQFHDPPQ